MSVPSRWLTISVRVSESEASGLVVQSLLELGGRAVEEDGRALVTHVPEPPDPPGLVNGLRAELAAALPGVELEVATDWQSQEEWAEVWKWGLAPRRVTPRLVVTPSWCRPEIGPDDLVVVLDPGVAFGTAEHGTTRGCLRLLEAALRAGDRVVDVGTGSGILAIAAARLGASEVLALEADPLAVEAARENVAANAVREIVRVRAERVGPDELAALGPVDGVVANIELGVLLELLPGFAAASSGSGWLVLGGVPADEWDELDRAAAEAGFRPGPMEDDGGWRSKLFHRT